MFPKSAPCEDRKLTRRAGTHLCVLALLFFFAADASLHPQGRRNDAFRMMAVGQRRVPPTLRNQEPRNNQNSGNERNEQQNSGRGNKSNNQRQDHLAEWMQAHKNLTVDQQVEALQKEPGFSQLPPDTQQRYIQHLRELNAMDPQQQATRTRNIEAMERMTPQQRQQFRGALLAISAMPAERQRMVRKAFRDLRQVPVEQRPAVLNSEQFRTEFSDHERGVLRNLLAVEPYLPPVRPGPQVQYGGK